MPHQVREMYLIAPTHEVSHTKALIKSLHMFQKIISIFAHFPSVVSVSYFRSQIHLSIISSLATSWLFCAWRYCQMRMLLFTFHTYMPNLSRDNTPILAKSKQKQAELGKTKRNTPTGSYSVNSMHQLRSSCYVEGATCVPSLWL